MRFFPQARPSFIRGEPLTSTLGSAVPARRLSHVRSGVLRRCDAVSVPHACLQGCKNNYISSAPCQQRHGATGDVAHGALSISKSCAIIGGYSMWTTSIPDAISHLTRHVVNSVRHLCRYRLHSHSSTHTASITTLSPSAIYAFLPPRAGIPSPRAPMQHHPTCANRLGLCEWR